MRRLFELWRGLNLRAETKLVEALVGLVVAHVEHELPAGLVPEGRVLVAEASERGVLATDVVRVVGIVLADPAVFLERLGVVLHVLGLAPERVPAVLPPVVELHRRSVAGEVLLARERSAPRRDAAGAVADRAIDRGADALGADQRASELELRAVAVDAPVVVGGRSHLPGAVAALLDVQDRVANRVLLLLHLRGGLGAGVRLIAVQEEGVGVLVVDEQQALAAAVERE